MSDEKINDAIEVLDLLYQNMVSAIAVMASDYNRKEKVDLNIEQFVGSITGVLVAREAVRMIKHGFDPIDAVTKAVEAVVLGVKETNAQFASEEENELSKFELEDDDVTSTKT